MPKHPIDTLAADNNILICDDALRDGSGLLSALKAKMSESDIQDMELLGYIDIITSPQNETWRITTKGRYLRELIMGRRTIVECVKDWICVHLLGFRIKI